MEDRIRSLLLTLLMASPCLPLAAAETSEQELKPVIQPEVSRTEFQESRIDTEDFEVTGFLGILSIEDFGTNPVYGAKLGYHISEELFVEGVIGTSEAGLTSAEALNPTGATLLSDDERQFTYYNLSVGFNLLPGETFPTKNTTYNTDLYLVAGAGSTQFAGADHFTLNFGLGYRFYATDYLAIKADFQDLLLNVDITGENKTTHNLQFTLGVAYFF
ncbi:MAG: outer membrane beta-barrel domain-containing protein [Proteobacteria bacterium]|jgi:outer membrane beta-barrel protein|nr:outer membrane beta-barrel domain-containing protein [Pseudomonadota bacterium]